MSKYRPTRVMIAILAAAAAASGLVQAGGEEAMSKEGDLTSDKELRRRLTPEQYHVVRENGTERPFENAYWDLHEPGIYVDVVSGEPLFSSRDKFDSGTGWPSFTAPLENDNIVTRTDRGLWMTRTEVRSKKGNSHLGHVFDDGPAPAGKRYCINSAALRFIPASRLKEEGYGRFLALFAGSAGAPKTRKAAFAAGCFWGVEAAFGKLKGVVRTTVGYTGGRTKSPTYEQVCSGATGHAEAVEVEFDSARVSYARLLEVFWKIHDPTTLNRQGPDVGAQYRSAIFTHGPEQRKEALDSRERLVKSGKHQGEIVTQIEPAAEFWPAEEYHQKYYEKRGGKACHIF